MRTTEITKPQPWFHTWFDTPFYHRLYGNRDDAEATRFIDVLIGKLRMPRGSRILDLGCGSGRHSICLASRGYTVTGLDLSAHSILLAKRSEKPGLQFRRHDMLLPFGHNAYDYLFNFFTSFGYFPTDSEHKTVVTNMSDALKPGGVLLLDYLNPRVTEKALVPVEEKEIEGVVYRIRRWTDSRFFYKRISLLPSLLQPPLEYVEQVARFEREDFEDLFAHSGLRLTAVYGDYRLSPYDRELSPRMILQAVKG